MTLLWRKVLECSSSLLTSSSLWSQSYGGRFWSVLPHTAHFVIPVISLLWRKVLECSSSHCSLRHPCVLTLMEEGSGVFFLTAHFVIPVSSLTSSSLCPHSLRYPCDLTPMTCLLTHLIVIPDFSLESSHPSHPWLLTLTSLVLPLIPYSVFSHTPTLIALTKSSHRHPWLLTPITCATMLTHPRVLSHLTSLSAHTHHLSSHTHHLTSSVTTRTLTSFSLVSPHWVISHHLCSERVSVPTSMVSYYHQVYSHTVFSLTHSPIHVIPVNTSMVSYYHQVYSHTVFSLTHSPIHVIPVNTSMVSYYHQVYPLTALRELVLPLTLPWCRTTTKSSLTALRELVLPLTLPWCRTTTKSSLTALRELVLPLTPIYHVLTHSAPLTSFHLLLATNASPMHHQPSPTLSHPSCLHHIIITSSPLPITYHHQSLPLTPHNTPNPSISLPTLPIVS